MQRLFGSDDRAVQFSVLAICAMLTLPFLYPYHHDPIGSFHSEWISAACGLLACLGLLSPRLWQRPAIPAIVWLPLTLAGIALLQLALGVVVFAQQTLLFLLYLLWALLLMQLGAGLRREIGLARLADWLAGAMFTGAAAGVALALLSHSGYVTDSTLLFPKLGATAIHGNIAQSNHFADQLWLGVASALYLALRGRVRTPIVALGLATLVAVSVLTGSRATLAYLCALVVMAGLARLIWPGETSQRALRLTLLLVPLYVAFQVLSWLAAHSGFHDVESPATKIAAASGAPIRLQLLVIGWEAFRSAPLLGHGIGSFPAQSLALAATVPFGAPPGTVEQAHDLPVHLAAEMGFAAPVALVVMLFIWIRGNLRHARPDEDESVALGWLLAVLTVLGLHSLVEYPLWYAFFLGPTALLLGIGDVQSLPLRLGGRGRLVAGLLLLAGAFVLQTLRADYLSIERAVNPFLGGQRRTSTWEDMAPLAEPLRRHSLLYPYYCPTATSKLRLPQNLGVEALETSECAMRVFPVAVVAFRRAMILAWSGRAAEAEAAWRQTLTAYPGMAATAAQELHTALAAYPTAPLASLLAIAEAARGPAPAANSR